MIEILPTFAGRPPVSLTRSRGERGETESDSFSSLRASASPRENWSGAKGRDEGWSNATLLAEPFEGGDFDDGFVEGHGGDGFTRRRGDAGVGRLLTMRRRPSLSAAAPKLNCKTWMRKQPEEPVAEVS